MPPFAGQGPQPLTGSQTAGHAQARACSQNRQGAVVLLAVLQHHLLVLAEVRQAVDKHAEIIHQLQLFDPCCTGQLLLLQLPGQIGDLS